MNINNLMLKNFSAIVRELYLILLPKLLYSTIMQSPIYIWTIMDYHLTGLFNLRGNDRETSPLFDSYVTIIETQVW